jgi:magnesium-transporting ATPase (P-type)
MRELHAFWKGNHYADLISIGVAIVGLVITLRKKSCFEDYKLFVVLFSGYIIVIISSFLKPASRQSPHLHLTLIQLHYFADIAFTILEFIIYSIFIQKQVKKGNYFLISIRFLFITYASGVGLTSFWEAGMPVRSVIDNLFTLQALCIFPGIIIYYFEIYSNESSDSKQEKPAFWIISGITLFMISTLPYSIIANYLQENYFSKSYDLFYIFYVFYILLFAMIIKAISCIKSIDNKKVLTTN